MRAIASRTAGVVSHSTVHQALTGKRIPRWGALELIVEALGGEPSEFHSLWKDVRVQVRQVPGGPTSGAVSVGGSRFQIERTSLYGLPRDFLTLEKFARIKKDEGPKAAANFLKGKIGKRWNSSLMATYLPLLDELKLESELSEILPHFRGLEMASAAASHVVAGYFDHLDEYSEALWHEARALRHDPNNPKYAWLVGSYSASLGLHDEKHKHYALAHRLDPQDVDFAESYVDSLLERSEFSKAEEIARTCWANERVRVQAGVALGLQGNFAEAEKVLRTISKPFADCVTSLAQVLVAQGRRDEALAVISERLERFPDDLTSGVMHVELLRDSGYTNAADEGVRRLTAAVAREEQRTNEMMAKIRALRES
ncbi:tetratricopeptide repeat protein [Streptomyces sp. cg28]|uniref:tetratricopeptide repeat protein n=1 Tax=Streptomyces sp. cg28 TaxID=3403457 RepID=UPI003B2137B6